MSKCLGMLCALLLLLPATVLAQFNYTTNSDGSLNLYQYTGSDSAVTIPNTSGNLPVRSIGSSAFYQLQNLTSVVIGTNVATISANAFFQCTNLASAVLPASVTNIGNGPFIDCQSLVSLSFASSNADFTITNNILFNRSLTSLIQFPNGIGGSYTISAAVTNVGSGFVGNTLASIAVNSTNNYFAGTNGVLFTKNLKYLLNYPGAVPGLYAVPAIVTNINSAAFEYSRALANVSISTNVASIGQFAFYDCTSLTNISVVTNNLYFSTTNGVLFDKKQYNLIQYPSGLPGTYAVPGTATNILGGAFGDAFELTSVSIPDSVTSIGAETFYSCFNLANVTLGNGIVTIGQQAFYACTSLTGIAIPNSTTNIANFAFYYCPSLASVTIGASLKSLGLEAFADCVSLTNVCFAGDAPVDGGSAFYYDLSLPTIYYVSTTTGWGAFYDGYPTTPCAECGNSAPTLTITRTGNKVVLTWSSTFTGYTLQSSTGLGHPIIWNNVSPAPVVINGFNTVTNAASSQYMFYRLQSP